MNTYASYRALGWLVRDTFRQSFASGICWLLAGVSTLCILVCLGVSVVGDGPLNFPGENPDFIPRDVARTFSPEQIKKSGVKVVGGHLRVALGAIKIPLTRDARDAVHLLELILAAGVADTLGLLLTLVWTAGFLPSFLDSRHVSVLLAKPVPRWWLLIGKYVGVLAFVLLHAVVFVGGTWTALGLRTGVWDVSYLWAIPLLLLHFSIFFGCSLLLAVLSRNTVVCVFGSIAFWMLCWGMNYGRHMVSAADHLAHDSQLAPELSVLADFGYWLFPKPADIGVLVYEALGAKDYFQPLFAPSAQIWFAGSVATSLLFTAMLVWIAARQFEQADY